MDRLFSRRRSAADGEARAAARPCQRADSDADAQAEAERAQGPATLTRSVRHDGESLRAAINAARKERRAASAAVSASKKHAPLERAPRSLLQQSIRYSGKSLGAAVSAARQTRTPMPPPTLLAPAAGAETAVAYRASAALHAEWGRSASSLSSRVPAAPTPTASNSGRAISPAVQALIERVRGGDANADADAAAASPAPAARARAAAVAAAAATADAPWHSNAGVPLSPTVRRIVGRVQRSAALRALALRDESAPLPRRSRGSRSRPALGRTTHVAPAYRHLPDVTPAMVDEALRADDLSTLDVYCRQDPDLYARWLGGEAGGGARRELPVHRAARCRALRCLEFLLELGGGFRNVDVPDGRGRSALIVAAACGASWCVEALVDWGADVDRACHGLEGAAGGASPITARWTPLMFAVAMEDADATLTLLDAGANTEARDATEVSVLLFTVTLYANLAHSLTRSP